MNRHRFSDVVTCDIMFSKVSQLPVFSLPVGVLRSFSIFYITFINNKNNVTTSLANVYRPFLGDVKVTFSLFVPVSVRSVLFPAIQPESVL